MRCNEPVEIANIKALIDFASFGKATNFSHFMMPDKKTNPEGLFFVTMDLIFHTLLNAFAYLELLTKHTNEVEAPLLIRTIRLVLRVHSRIIFM